MYNVIQIDKTNRSDVKKFVDFAFELYKNNKYWVPPLKNKQIKLLTRGESMQLSSKDYELFAVIYDGKIVGRILVGINHVKNKQKNSNEGYFSLFECIDDVKAASLLIDTARDWLKKRGAEFFTGPVSPTNGDDDRGILIEGFNRMPTVNTAYTMDYYPKLFKSIGLSKYLDFYAFAINFDNAKVERVKNVVEYGKKKSSINIAPLNFNDIETDVKDIYNILVNSMRSQWDHLETPTFSQLNEEFKMLKSMIDPALVLIARVKDEPVGFVAGIPDYNQALCHMKGKMNIISAIKFLYYKYHITRVKFFMQFVIPQYQGTFVLPSLYLAMYENFLKRGYLSMECATVAEINAGSLNTLEGVGFEKCMTYRIYKCTI